MTRNSKLAAATIAFLLILGPRPALAYLDPGTGSYVVQIVIASILGAAFAVKMFWLRIKNFMARLFTRGEDRD